MNLIVKFDFTFSKTKQCFSTLWAVILWFFMKMGCMDELQPIFEQSTLSDFKMWRSRALKAVNNHSIVTINNKCQQSHKCGAVIFVTNFWIYSRGCLGFMLFLNILMISETSFGPFEKSNPLSLVSYVLCHLKYAMKAYFCYHHTLL